ncbi:MAG: fibronectin type III domain-containing protein [Lewinellaceae bacterium]|nr:fibronectin type III domain-containing protein [Lewinellaceae bacterium]
MPGGFSAWSPELKFRTLEAIRPEEKETSGTGRPCSTPDTSQMQVVRIGPDYATIHTTYFSEKGFQFRFRRMEDNTWNVRPAIKSPDMTATPLSPGTTYYVSMRAGCMQGISDWSEALPSSTTTACSGSNA